MPLAPPRRLKPRLGHLLLDPLDDRIGRERHLDRVAQIQRAVAAFGELLMGGDRDKRSRSSEGTTLS
jgi:hypothetical protein